MVLLKYKTKGDVAYVMKTLEAYITWMGYDLH
jgi:hypothetical protein